MPPITASEIARDPYLFACANGVVDLRTGTLRPYESPPRFRPRCQVDFTPLAADSPWWPFLADFTAQPPIPPSCLAKPA